MADEVTIKEEKPKNQAPVGLIKLLRPHLKTIVALVALTLLANGLNLAIPRIIANGIDSYVRGNFVLRIVVIEFLVISVGIFIFTYLQSVVQVYASERVARDLRLKVATKISLQSNASIEQITSAKLLTNLTSDVDAVKFFVAQAISSIISSAFLIVGASFLLISINWKLGLSVLGILPLISLVFYLVLTRVRKLFKRSQQAIDWLNKVINGSILGSTLVRLLNSQQAESQKFIEANTEAKNIGMSILRLFAIMVPVVTFATNLATLIILAFGGHLIITGELSLGNFTAFYSYLAILILPVLIIGIMSNFIAQASASYARIEEVLIKEEKKRTGTIVAKLHGDIEAKNLVMSYGEKAVLKNVSFEAKAGTRNAIIGPTAAGKTQLLSILIGLLEPTSGTMLFDGIEIDKYSKESLHQQIGFVFQDSALFNLTLRENIAFSKTTSEESLKRAIITSELSAFIKTLPNKLETVVSERGTSLSGGQKQRVMLARALALNPKILFLDDFTSRVDTATEKKILDNVRNNYPGITLISVTQKISSMEDYDQIILLMEGEILAKGTHKELMKTCPEYVQIYNSQQSTTHYELRS